MGFDEVSQSLSIMMRLIPPVNKTASRRIYNRTSSIVGVNCACVKGGGEACAGGAVGEHKRTKMDPL